MLHLGSVTFEPSFELLISARKHGYHYWKLSNCFVYLTNRLNLIRAADYSQGGHAQPVTSEDRHLLACLVPQCKLIYKFYLLTVLALVSIQS